MMIANNIPQVSKDQDFHISSDFKSFSSSTDALPGGSMELLTCASSCNPCLNIKNEFPEIFQFHYLSDIGQHGGLEPIIELHNCDDPSNIYIKASLYTNEESPRLHTNFLHGQQGDNGACWIELSKDFTASFPPLSILIRKREEKNNVLKERLQNKYLQLGIHITEKDLLKEVNMERKKIDNDCIRFCFEAFYNKDESRPVCEKIFSKFVKNGIESTAKGTVVIPTYTLPVTKDHNLQISSLDFKSLSSTEALPSNSNSSDTCASTCNPYLAMKNELPEIFQFRYLSDSGEHGGLEPIIELHNCVDPSNIFVKASLYTINEENPRLHTNFLHGSLCDNGVCWIKLLNDFTAKFPLLPIFIRGREEKNNILKGRIKNKYKQLEKNLLEKDLLKKVNEERKKIDNDCIRFCFEAFYNKDESNPVCPKIFSNPIRNKRNLNLTIKNELPELFRFHYLSEGGQHRGLEPLIELHNCADPSNIYIKASLYTCEETPRLHTNFLRGTHCADGVCWIKLTKDFTAKFPKLVILIRSREEKNNILKERIQNKYKNVATQITEKDLLNEVNVERKKIDNDCIRFCFEAFYNEDESRPACKRIFSKPIKNEKPKPEPIAQPAKKRKRVDHMGHSFFCPSPSFSRNENMFPDYHLLGKSGPAPSFPRNENMFPDYHLFEKSRPPPQSFPRNENMFPDYHLYEHFRPPPSFSRNEHLFPDYHLHGNFRPPPNISRTKNIFPGHQVYGNSYETPGPWRKLW